MTNEDFQLVREFIFSYSNTAFEPCVNVFENGIVINHQKVGTRFLEKIVSGEAGFSRTDHRQVMFGIFRTPHTFSNHSEIKYHFGSRYIMAPWHDKGNEDSKYLVESYKIWKSDKTFFESNNVNNYTEFFFNNKKDIYFIIRNPIHRFFSGILEILAVEPEGITLDRFRWIMMNNWRSIFEDIHTVNYLEHIKEMIYNIKDKSRIKILDLSHLKTENAYQLFCDLRGDTKIKNIYKNLDHEVNSNKDLYSQFYSLYSSEDLEGASFVRYLRNEYGNYLELRNSEYFLNLL